MSGLKGHTFVDKLRDMAAERGPFPGMVRVLGQATWV